MFDAGCANFWFSHIPKNKIEDFYQTFNRKLKTGSPVFIADNIFVPGMGGELIQKPDDKNTYKLRKLNDNSSYEIIKNYYNEEELLELFNNIAVDIEIVFRKCFWLIKYKTC